MIAGVDEVGRGCLAGPVIAASVILKRPIKGLMDSKKLSSKKRESLSQEIIENSIFAIGAADNLEIDKINILQASLLAMKRSLEKLDVKPKKINLISDALKAELKDIINEVLDEREKKDDGIDFI